MGAAGPGVGLLAAAAAGNATAATGGGIVALVLASAIAMSGTIAIGKHCFVCLWSNAYWFVSSDC